LAVGVAAEVKSKLSVLEIVGEQVELRKAGTTYKGLCPFHGEKTPSFVVTPARESWHCFGCGEGGDIFSFVMRRESLSFPEALKRLAARAGIEVDERTSREDARKARLREVLEQAIAFYHVVLTQSKTGAPALEYLHGRGFTDATIERFQLGWAPGGWDQMIKMLQSRRNVAVAELAEVGLTSARQGGRGAYDKFRSRVIFPIRDASGNAVGIGGRILPTPKAAASPADAAPDAGAHDGGAPKYLNSPATSLFDKSRTLYLIERARGEMRRTEEAVLVEGYTDALMAHQAGFENVVASLGTALTPAQVALIARYAREIVLAYDVDPAGQHAGSIGGAELFRLIGSLAAEETGVEITRVRVARLPEGKDPDEVIRDTPDLWREAIRTAQPIIEFLIDYYATAFPTRTAEGRRHAVGALIPILREIRDPIMRDSYLQTLARRTGVEERVLLEALRAPVPVGQAGADARGGSGTAGAGSGRFTADAVMSAPDTIDTKAELKSLTREEARLLRLLLLVPEQQERVADALAAQGARLPSTPARELLAEMIADRDRDREAGGPGDFKRMRYLEALPPELHSLAIALYADRGPNDPTTLDTDHVRNGVDQCLLALEADRLEDEIRFNAGELTEAQAAVDPQAIARLLETQRNLYEARNSLDRRREAVSNLTPAGGHR
jgi:DNA primase catalytic core